MVSYNGLNVTLSNGKVTIPFTFSSSDELDRSLYIEDPLAKYDWPEATKQLIREQKIKTGMNQAQVWAAYGYGPTRTTESSLFDMWSYPQGSKTRYLYFTDGLLTDWVDL